MTKEEIYHEFKRNTLTDQLIDRLEEDIYLIEKGVRTCAYHQYECDYLDTVVTDPDSYIYTGNKIKYIVKENKDKHYGEIFLYKYQHQKKIYQLLENLEKSEDPNISYILEYIMGKLLGYSDESMEDYLSRYENDFNKDVNKKDD